MPENRNQAQTAIHQIGNRNSFHGFVGLFGAGLHECAERSTLGHARKTVHEATEATQFIGRTAPAEVKQRFTPKLRTNSRFMFPHFGQIIQYRLGVIGIEPTNGQRRYIAGFAV